MSIRNALLGSILGIYLVFTILIGAVSVLSVNRSIRREAQERVNHDLHILENYYRDRVDALADIVNEAARAVNPDSLDVRRLSRIRDEYGLTLLNVCTIGGEPLQGSYENTSGYTVPVTGDPVIRKALAGESSAGTTVLDSTRIAREGGRGLQKALAVVSPDSSTVSTSALFMWAASPVRDENGVVHAVVYGGRSLNYNFALVDDMRSLLFGEEEYLDKPLGTVTIFMQGIRVATNVLAPGGVRAVGTHVSAAVGEQVLSGGRQWQDRARVVDTWYISGYTPIRNPRDAIVGMLYVGLLEAPYDAARNELITRIIGPVIALFVVISLLTLVIVRKITSPLRSLGTAAKGLEAGEWETGIEVESSFSEINHFRDAFLSMRDALVERDTRLSRQNRHLEQTNESLQRTMHNYMEMLGFITHELKNPLASIQTMISVMTDTMEGEMSGDAAEFLLRIKRNAEELQDMVKNYLDLSRIERGELEAHPRDIDLVSEVLQPAIDQNISVVQSHGIMLETALPDSLGLHADPELLRITVSNFLSNAVKYGTENGTIRLEASRHEHGIIVSVWNQGRGFTPEDKEHLFRKFSRLQNRTTRDKHGSGLGLYICREIVELHGGRIWAESEPGEWARFSFLLPVTPS